MLICLCITYLCVTHFIINVFVYLSTDTGMAGKPFRATEIWNSVVDNLQTQVKVKRRRRNLKIYDDCFLGSEAVDVVLAHIVQCKICKDAEVPRFKAIQLCQKLMDARVFEKVDNNVFGIRKSQAKFRDSRFSLYRFLTTTGASDTTCIGHVKPREHLENRIHKNVYGV